MVSSRCLSVERELIDRFDDNDRCVDFHPLDLDYCLQDMIRIRTSDCYIVVCMLDPV